MTRTLIVMAKAPALGRGKTRLARGAGRAAALRINRALQAHTVRVASSRRWTTLLAVTPESACAARLPDVWPDRIVRMKQGGGDLGARLSRVLARVRGHVAVIGTDCPAVEARDIAAAFRALGRAPVAVGPATDGGFWILAARRAGDVAHAFSGVRWSSVHTLDDLEERLRVRVVRLRTLSDIDTIDDWRAFRARTRQIRL
ncbi:MAG: TIGR04282 family arsenosugar biosynthesis glycosyltransferase [Hyphomonadaceae bacterium]|nr:MAG: hypothetical protein FD160_1406 [Caulobacteraceae bacterium]MBT9447317.1 TIGR04282 family arsenosugar biosynthesis glycosyltransferase [Hyphomonadaceae bacterium]TPW08272.1 MAG: hypothetical protein FD124_493 [Alphaproteobacteria bacterium]